MIRLYEKLPKNTATYVLGKQLIRSTTSTAANYRAACVARSIKERYSKMCIVVEEADETQFWLELLSDLNTKFDENIQPLLIESKELSKIMSAYRFKIKQNLQTQ